MSEPACRGWREKRREPIDQDIPRGQINEDTAIYYFAPGGCPSPAEKYDQTCVKAESRIASSDTTSRETHPQSP